MGFKLFIVEEIREKWNNSHYLKTIIKRQTFSNTISSVKLEIKSNYNHCLHKSDWKQTRIKYYFLSKQDEAILKIHKQNKISDLDEYVKGYETLKKFINKLAKKLSECLSCINYRV